MNPKKLLAQALLFEQESPVYSKVKELFSAVKKYESENGVFVLCGKRGERVELKNREAFFAFVSELSNVAMQKFEDIQTISMPLRAKKISSLAGILKTATPKCLTGLFL